MEKKQTLGVMAGSLRKQSFSRALGHCLGALAPEHVTIEELPSIGDLPLFNQDIMDETGAPTALTQLAERISAVDGVIIISPEYNWSIPGALKNALDWLSRLNPAPLAEKPVTIFTCSPGLLGGARAHPPIRNVLHALDCRILARPEVQITQIKAKMAPDLSAVTDSATAEFITQRLAAFSAFAQRG
ncbi:NADPH-dependent FMN reductase [Agrobacterium sp. lyk4-40-TYG-31]|uniref:NADPH-dependent FMN reductase n=1 Tax=Agrobacterium sp. lyk4-40-TYG-31 TaxID=3040276 RepID=UPI00254EDC05|nr:NADPH-dependent FMN reductase [Agrobacterium sp. lyk4-40-TYG-31]